LAKKGYQITGVDTSPAMLDKARSRVTAEGQEQRVELVQQNMQDLNLDRRFNLAFLAINTFMHMQTTDDQLEALASIRRHLVPGGLLVLDLFNPDLEALLSAQGQLILEKEMVDPETGKRYQKFYTRTADLERQMLHITFLVDATDDQGVVSRTTFSFSIRYLFWAELALLLRHAGFEVESVYGSYDLDEFSGTSPKMIAVARRPG
jgi:ubiquinone/menaquinone biosynthesis C-methylase UbiE